MQYINQVAQTLVPYRDLLMIGFMAILFTIAVLIIKVIFRKAKEALSRRQKISKDNLKNVNVRKLYRSMHGKLIRTILSADGVNTNPLSYMTLMDGGREVYIRTFTVTGKPKRATFAKTFTKLFDFNHCTSSVFLMPISEEEMSRKLDKHITILTSERNASKDPNRRRKLYTQESEANSWAQEIENGDNKLFQVGFLFSIYADSLQELNKLSDSFYTEALAKGILVSACYGMQGEAYALNGPFNKENRVSSSTLTDSPVCYLTMDKFSVSTLINYLQSNFSHKSGVPLGRDMITGMPVVFNLFDQSHDAYTLAIAGGSGSGKSTVIKCMTSRECLFGTHFVALDSQEKKGTSEGEYAALARAVGGINFQLRNDAEECLNLFDISETIRSEKITETNYREVRTVDLAGKTTTLVDILCSMILNSAEKKFDSVNDQTYVKRILTDAVTQTYNEFGIEEGKVESLYENRVETKGGITTNQQRKKMPTLGDCFRRLLINQNNNTEEELTRAYTLVTFSLQDRVKEIIYNKETMQFYSRAAYDTMTADEKEKVTVIRGTKAYYDGQSTISISRDCPFVNFDISLLSEVEMRLAGQIAMAWITEYFVKKNSEKLDSNDKLILILDEVHKWFKDPYARNTIDTTVREARKRNVGVILATQTLTEYDNYKETKDLLDLMECKFVFKQGFQSRDYLIKTLGITSAQSDMIVGTLGGSGRDTEDEKKRHRGEMCIVDNKKVCFCKVDYLKETEGLLADTNAAEYERMLKQKNGVA